MEEEISNGLIPSLPDELEEAIKELPEPQKGVIKKSIHMSFQGMFRPMDSYSKLIDKNHLTQIITNAEEESKREHKAIESSKKYVFFTFLIFIVFIGSMAYIFKNNIENALKLIIPIITFATGALGGYGYGYRKGQDSC